MTNVGESLSERELQVITLVATGATNRMIAQELSISPNTVKVHLRNIFAKLEISSRTEATALAFREGWVPMPGVYPSEAAAAPLEGTVVEAETTDRAQPMPERESPPLLPASWPRRIYLLLTIMFAVVGSWVSWPRPIDRLAEFCRSDFTAECSQTVDSPVVSEPESRWVSGTPLPLARGRFAMVNYGGELYVIGGETADGVVGTLEIYEPQSDSWRHGADKPIAVSNVSAVAVEHQVYVAGGGDALGTPSAALEIYHPSSDTWSEGPLMPVALAAHASAAWAGRMIVAGGWDGSGYSSRVMAFDPEDGQWTRLADLPTPRGFAGAAVLGDQLYVVGGYDGSRELAACERYDLREDQWSSCASLSTPRGGMGVVATVGQLFAIGGGWGSYVTFSERYSPSADAWTSVETPLLLAGGEWRFLGAAAIGTEIHAMGGWQQGRYLTVNQVFETLPNRLYLPAASDG